MKKINRLKIQNFLNISHSTVSQWFNGKTKPTADKMFKLEDEFGIPVQAWRDIKSYLNNHTPTQNNVQGNS